MKTYLYKFLGYLLISLAIALAFGPFDGNPFEKKINAEQMEWYCQNFPLNCETRKKEDTHKLFVAYPKLAYLKYLFGSILFFFGIIALRKSYKDLPGIRINTNTDAVTLDIIGIFFLNFGAYCVWAFLFHHLAEVKIYLYDYDGDASGLSITALFFVPVTAFLAFLAPNMTGQSIEIDSEGLTVHYPGDTEHISWSNVQSIGAKETYTFSGNADIIIPRHFQTKLRISGTEDSMELFEPGSKKTKKKIVASLEQFAPDRLQKDIAQLKEKW